MIVHSTKELGQRFKERRVKLKITQAQLTDITGVSSSFISNFENGKETCEIGKVIYLMNMIGMDLDVLERGE